MANISDINAECRALCDADTTSYPAATLLRRINESYERRVGQIIRADGRWQFDDTNFTSFPIATTTLVNSQSDYTFDSSHLEIERVQVKDVNGIWHLLSPIDISQIGEAVDEFYKTDGLPLYYDKQGSSLVLYPAPDNGASVTLSAGLKVFFKRTADTFTSAQVTAGTKEPGFASPYHYILAYDAAIPFCLTYKPERVALLRIKAKELEEEMLAHYGAREQDRVKRLEMGGVDAM